MIALNTALEDFQLRRDYGPGRAIAGEDRDGGMEERRVVERARVDREHRVLADFAAEDEAAANGAGIAHGVAAVRGFGDEFSGLAREAHGARREPHEGNETRARSLAAIGAVTVTHELRFTFGFITDRAAETAAGIALSVFAHRHLLRRLCGRVNWLCRAHQRRPGRRGCGAYFSTPTVQ